MTKSSICFQGQVLSGAGYLCLSFHSILAPWGALPQHLFPLSIAVKQTTPHLEEPIATTVLDRELMGGKLRKCPVGMALLCSGMSGTAGATAPLVSSSLAWRWALWLGTGSAGTDHRSTNPRLPCEICGWSLKGSEQQSFQAGVAREPSRNRALHGLTSEVTGHPFHPILFAELVTHVCSFSVSVW